MTRKRTRTLATALGALSLAISSLSYLRPQASHWTISGPSYGLKLLAGAITPFLALLGVVGAILGGLVQAPLAVASGTIGALLAARTVRRVTAPHCGFQRAFGPDWRQNIPPQRSARLLQRRWVWQPMLTLPQARFESDLPFWTLPDTQRDLLCDLWQPAGDVPPSGLALIYLHGGAWQSFDKDTFTRPFFRYLAGQGHVIMDVAYRLCPEADMAGIIGDVKRAIAWIKANAERYSVDPARVVVAGGSSGGHLALLAAYAANHPRLDPADVGAADTSVRAVVSYYGLPDLRQRGAEPSQPSSHILVQVGKKMGLLPGRGYLEPSDLARKLLGGLPQEVPDIAALMSPITHVGPHCPPTLLLQGSHDHITPLGDVRNMHRALSDAGVPVVYVELPQVEHAFDLFLPHISPPAQAALYDVERFLALML